MKRKHTIIIGLITLFLGFMIGSYAYRMLQPSEANAQMDDAGPVSSVTLKWVNVKHDPSGVTTGSTDRARVPGGWLVRIYEEGYGVAFVPDPEHKWE